MCGLVECVPRVCYVFLKCVVCFCLVCVLSLLHCMPIMSTYVLCSKSHYIPAVRVNTLAKPVFISTTIAPASCNMIAITEFICKRDLWPSLWQLLIPPTPAGQVAT